MHLNFLKCHAKFSHSVIQMKLLCFINNEPLEIFKYMSKYILIKNFVILFYLSYPQLFILKAKVSYIISEVILKNYFTSHVFDLKSVLTVSGSISSYGPQT